MPSRSDAAFANPMLSEGLRNQSPLVPQASDGRTEHDFHELCSLVKVWNEAIARKDVEILRRLWAADFVAIGLDGTPSTRDEDLEAISSPYLEIKSLAVDDVDVRVYGDAAVVTGRAQAAGTFESADISGAFRFMNVFVRRNGSWVAVASQATGCD